MKSGTRLEIQLVNRTQISGEFIGFIESKNSCFLEIRPIESVLTGKGDDHYFVPPSAIVSIIGPPVLNGKAKGIRRRN